MNPKDQMIEQFNSLLTEYIEIQSNFLIYIKDNSDTDQFAEFTKFIDSKQIGKSKTKIIPFLLILSQLSGSHYRYFNFLEKLNKILLFISSSIKKQLESINEIFNIFKYNKTILLFVLEHIDQFTNVLNAKNELLLRIFNSDDEDLFQYFYPELRELCEDNQNEQNKLNIKEFNDKVDEYRISQFIKTNDTNRELFDQYRKQGENESEIATIIRNDDLEQFLAKKPKFNQKISSSPFESNAYLLDHGPILIEYASFMGSVNIFSYLLENMNKTDINPKIFSYAVHGLNMDIIHKLEVFFNLSNQEALPKFIPNLKDCFLEAIKSQHNEISESIQSTYLVNVPIKYVEASISSYNDFYIKKAFDASHNLLTNPKEAQNLFNHFCANGYINVVEFLLNQPGLININGKDAIRINHTVFQLTILR